MQSVQDLIDEYNLEEKKGLSFLPNVAIEAFSLITFNSIGWPTRIINPNELWRYHDSQHESPKRYRRYLNLLPNITSQESRLLKQASSIIYNFSKDFSFRYLSAGENALTTAFFQFRTIQKYYPNLNKNKIILEIGPGSGYLGLLLGLSGYKYLAMEACQALYIYQSSLFEYAFGNKYDNGLKNRNIDCQIKHITWWDFNSKNYHVNNLSLTTCNHAILEMTNSAFNRILNVIKRSSKKPELLAESPGSNLIGSFLKLEKYIKSNSFSLSSPSKGIYIFKISDRPGVFLSLLTKLSRKLPNELYNLFLIVNKISIKLNLLKIFRYKSPATTTIDGVLPLKGTHFLDTIYKEYNQGNHPGTDWTEGNI